MRQGCSSNDLSMYCISFLGRLVELGVISQAVAIRKLRWHMTDKKGLWDTDAMTAAFKKLDKFIEEAVGQPYSLKGLLTAKKPEDKVATSSYFCSELLAGLLVFCVPLSL